jgi:hypothetical protein
LEGRDPVCYEAVRVRLTGGTPFLSRPLAQGTCAIRDLLRMQRWPLDHHLLLIGQGTLTTGLCLRVTEIRLWRHPCKEVDGGGRHPRGTGNQGHGACHGRVNQGMPGCGLAGRGGRFPPQPRYQRRVEGFTASHVMAPGDELPVGTVEVERTTAKPLSTSLDPCTISKAKKPNNPFCFRCKLSGHMNEDCKAILDCVVCNKKNSHVVAKCPLLKFPRSDASFFGFGNNDLGFFRIPEFDYKLETLDPAPTALIKVTGGKLTPAAVQTELARFITKDWTWEALPHSEESFLVVFPSVEELQRMVDVDFTLKNHGVTLTISEWKDASDADPSYQLDEVWVHIKGVPHAWRHYLGFWALGSVIGATLDVDMYTYRKMGVIRVLVGMMNRDPLPLTTDIVFGTKGYEITFVLEDEKFTPADPVVFTDVPRWVGKGGGDIGDDQDDKNPGHAKKKQRNGWSVGGSGASSGGGDSVGNDVPMLYAAALPLTTTLHGPFCSLFSSDGSTDAADHSSKYSGVQNPVCEVGAGTLLTPVDLCVTMGNSTSNDADLRKVTNDISYEPVSLSPSMQNKMLMPIVSQGMYGSLVQDTQEARDACDDDLVGSLCSSGTGSKFYPFHNGLFIRRSTSSNVLDANGLPRADEDATLKAMRRASRRNLDGDLCGKQLADRFLLPADNPQATQIL